MSHMFLSILFSLVIFYIGALPLHLCLALLLLKCHFHFKQHLPSIQWPKSKWFQDHKQPKRLFHLDTLRGMAALVVAIHHGIQDTHKNRALVTRNYHDTFMHPFTFKWWLQEGDFMVIIFLVLSGYILSKMHWQSHRSLKSLILNRCTRFYPMHFLGQFLYLTFTGYLFYHYRSKEFQSWDAQQLFSCLSLTHQWRVFGWTHIPICNYPAWTISMELLFNCIMYLVIHFLPVKWALLVFECGIVVTWHGFLVSSKMLQIGFAFLIGVLYQKMGDYHTNKPALQLIGDVLCVVWCAMGRQIMSFDAYLNPKDFQWAYMGVFWSLGLIILCNNSLIIRQVLAKGHVLGDASFALYLMHVPMNDFYVILVNKGYMPLISNDWMMAAWMTLLVAVAYQVHKRYEIPAKAYLDRQWRPLSVK